MMKKFLSLLTVLALVMSLIPAAFAADGVTTKEDLVAAVEAGGEVVLGGDIQLGERLDVKTTVKLDLNGYTLSTESAGNYGAVYVGTAGNLTVVDSGENGAITSNTYAIGNYGKVTIEGGSFSGADAALYNFYFDGSTYGKTEIKDGTFTGDIWNCGELTVANGSFDGLDNSGKATIKNGTFIGELVVGDGSDAAEVPEKGTLVIENGSFTDLADAIECAVAGATIKLADDVNLNNAGDVLDASGKTIDLNGKTLTGNVLGTLKVNGGKFVTPEGYNQIVPEAASYGPQDIFVSNNAVVTMAGGMEGMSLTMESGTVSLAQNWYTLDNQDLVVAEGATFAIPADMWFYIKAGTTATVNGTLAMGANSSIKLEVGATLVAENGLNVVSVAEGYVAKYSNGAYSLIKNEAKISYETNGGSAVDPETIVPDGEKTFTKPANPTKDGFTFAGWYCEEALETPYSFDSIPVAGDDMTIYAKWTANSGGNPGSGSPAPSNPPAAPTDPEEPKEEEEGNRIFDDIGEDHTFVNEIEWAYNEGYVKGTGEDTYDSSASISRQQLWMVLSRHADEDASNMTDAKDWAVELGLSDGTDPGAAISRQQMVTMLYRYAQLMGYDTSAKADLSAYPDAANVADYAADAMAWAVANGIVNGTTAGTLNPAGNTTRGAFAAILYRFCEKVA